MKLQSDVLGWARLWAALDPTQIRVLRRGAWYPIVATASSRIIVCVDDQHVAVPAAWVETRNRRPDHFTVVTLVESEPNPVRGSANDLGRTYAVCPRCSRRLRLDRNATELWCIQCCHAGDVAWWETG